MGCAHSCNKCYKEIDGNNDETIGVMFFGKEYGNNPRDMLFCMDCMYDGISDVSPEIRQDDIYLVSAFYANPHDKTKKISRKQSIELPSTTEKCNYAINKLLGDILREVRSQKATSASKP